MKDLLERLPREDTTAISTACQLCGWTNKQTSSTKQDDSGILSEDITDDEDDETGAESEEEEEEYEACYRDIIVHEGFNRRRGKKATRPERFANDIGKSNFYFTISL